MSLVHESIVTLVNRRFVSTYYNDFMKIGGDKGAKEYVDKYIKNSRIAKGKGVAFSGRGRYGMVFSNKNELINTFGIGSRTEFFLSLRSALFQHKDLNYFSPGEKKIIDKINGSSDVEAQLKAARLYSELTQFKKVAEITNKIINNKKASAHQIALAKYISLHDRVLQFNIFCYSKNEDGYIDHYLSKFKISEQLKSRITNHRNNKDKIHKSLKAELTAFSKKYKGLPDHLIDDVEVDLVSLDVKYADGGGFFPGYEFRKGVAIVQHKIKINDLIKKHSNSSRLGQLLFYKGLAEYHSDQFNDAHISFKNHFDRLPEDRYAILSRLHHKSYRFSPFKKKKR